MKVYVVMRWDGSDFEPFVFENGGDADEFHTLANDEGNAPVEVDLHDAASARTLLADYT